MDSKKEYDSRIRLRELALGETWKCLIIFYKFPFNTIAVTIIERLFVHYTLVFYKTRVINEGILWRRQTWRTTSLLRRLCKCDNLINLSKRCDSDYHCAVYTLIM